MCKMKNDALGGENFSVTMSLAYPVSMTYPVSKLQAVHDVDDLPGGGKLKLSKMKNKTRCAVNHVVHDVDVLLGVDNASQGSEKAKATQHVDADFNEFPDGDNPSCARCR